MLIGLGKMIKKVTSSLNLLASKVLGFTSITSVPVQKNSLIMYKGYGETLISKTEAPSISWATDPLKFGRIHSDGTNFSCLSYFGNVGYTRYNSEDMKTFTEIDFYSILNPISQAYDFDATSVNVLGALENGTYISIKQVPGTNGYNIFKSSKDFTDISALSLPTGVIASPERAFYHGTFGNNSYLTFSNTDNQNDYKLYRSSSITSTQDPTYTEVTGIHVAGDHYVVQGKIHYANEIFACVAFNLSTYRFAILYSTDGLNFSKTTHTVGENVYIRMATVNNKFVYAFSSANFNVNDGIYINVSDDFLSGETPISKTTPTAYPGVSNRFIKLDNSVLLNNKLYIPIQGTTSFMVSEDGVTWSFIDGGSHIEFDHEFISGTVVVDVPLAGGSSYYTTIVENSVNGFVAQSNSGSLAFSTDGTDWIYSSEYPLYPGWSNNIISANGKIYCYAGTRFIYSSDGISWTRGVDIDQQESAILTGGGFSPPQYINNIFLSLTGNILAYSTDGLNWTDKYIVPDYNDYMYDNTNEPIIFGNGTYLTMNENTGQTFVSSNGIDWSLGFNFASSTSNVFNMKNTFFEGGRFVTVGLFGENATSTDGINWTIGSNISLEENEAIYITGYENGIYFFVTNIGRTAWSSNGLSWNIDNTNTGDISLLSNVFSSNGKTIAYPYWVGGDTNFYLHSADRVNWTIQSFPTFTASTNVNFSEFLDEVIMVSNGQTEAEYGLTKTSTDLINWVDGFTFYNPVPAVRYQGSPPSLMNSGWFAPKAVNSSIRIETQVSIGDQGSGTAEVLTPVTVYSPTSTVILDSVTLRNTSLYPVSFDLAVITGSELLSSETVLVDDKVIQPGETVTELSSFGSLGANQKIVVLPSSVDALEVKVYGIA
jgi:hypothetical protein